VTAKSDIIVVGGGPAGSYSAYTAARRGASVTVCEEHETVGAPNHCAGHLNISGLKQLGIQVPSGAIENRIVGATFFSLSGCRFRLRCRSPVTYVVDRTAFDRSLAEQAMKTGVEYHFRSRVKSLLSDPSGVKGVKLSDGTRLEARMVIDAEGCSSAVLKTSGLRGVNASNVVRGIQVEVDRLEDVETDMVEVYLGREVAPDFFAWIIPRRDGTAKVGLATSKGNPHEYLDRFLYKHPVAAKKLGKSKITDCYAHPIPVSGPIPKTFFDGLLVVGDAASQVKPTTGGGVIFGLTCARIAGEVACEALKVGDVSAARLSAYERRWRRQIGFELKAMHWIRRMLNRVSDSRLDSIIELCNRVGVTDVLERFGDVDFQGRSLVSMVRHPAAFAVGAYFIYSWLISTPNI